MAKGQLRVLHVGVNALDAKLMARALEEAGYDVAWTGVETEAEYESMLDSSPQVVIADYTLPHFSGLRALELLKQRHSDVPFILVSESIGEEKSIEVMRLGADNYLLKDRVGQLPSAVERALEETEGRAAHKRAKAEIEAGSRRAQACGEIGARRYRT